jgi:sugar phosphate isomerase/epimerase
MAQIPVALQLFSVREDAAKDLPGVLKQVAEMGYDGVEFAGYYDYSAEDLRALLDENGLRCAGTHTGINTLADDVFEETVAFNKILGNPYLIVPGLPEEYRDSIDAWKRTAERFNELAEKAAAAEMRVGYHNHFHEFQPMDGEIPWDVFFGNTREDVIMQADTGNALHGGADVVEYIKKYPGRAVTVHLKEYKDGWDQAVIGQGDVNWQELFTTCEAQGITTWYIVEQENYAAPPLECVRQCREALREMGK